VDEARTAKHAASRRDQAIAKRVYWVSAKIGNGVSFAAFAILALLGLLSLLSFDALAAKFGSFAALLVVCLVMVWDQAGKLAGFSALQVRGWVQRRVTRSVYETLVAFVVPGAEIPLPAAEESQSEFESDGAGTLPAVLSLTGSDLHQNRR
jgi:hypothetical protein